MYITNSLDSWRYSVKAYYVVARDLVVIMYSYLETKSLFFFSAKI